MNFKRKQTSSLLKLIFWNVCCGYCLSLSAVGRGKCSPYPGNLDHWDGRVYNHQESWGDVSCLPKLLRFTQLCFWCHSQLSDSGMHNCSAPVHFKFRKIIYCILGTSKHRSVIRWQKLNVSVETYMHTHLLLWHKASENMVSDVSLSLAASFLSTVAYFPLSVNYIPHCAGSAHLHPRTSYLQLLFVHSVPLFRL